MTPEEVADHRFCARAVDEDRPAHQWEYLGRVAQAYRCRICPVEVSKAKLKEATDAKLHV